MDIALLWESAESYFGAAANFGSTHHAVQAHIRKLYNDAGIKLLMSAFGATEFPT